MASSEPIKITYWNIKARGYLPIVLCKAAKLPYEHIEVVIIISLLLIILIFIKS